MCQTCQKKDNKDNVFEKKFRLADFFISHWDEYCKNPKEFIRPEQYKAVNAIRVCRTEVLGIDYYACQDCGEISEVSHDCKNRFCPNCSWKDTIRWAEKVKSKMYNLPHRHVVFTLDHQLNGLIKYNKKEILNIMARVSAGILKSWFKDKYNINIGIVTVIHTAGEKKNAHYHVHMLVSWGGMEFETQKLINLVEEAKKEGNKNKSYIDYKFIKKRFRDEFTNQLDNLYKNKDLKHNFKSEIEFKKFKSKLYHKPWQIHFEDPMETPADVIRYIGRYSKRACISDYKIKNIQNEHITFTYKDYADREDPKDKKSPAKVKELALHYNKFFPLILQHVPPKHFRLVRYYGAYARPDKIPSQYRSEQIDEISQEQIEIEYQTSEENPKYCGACTKAKIYITTLFDTRKKAERTEMFDIKKHKHSYYEIEYLKEKNKDLKQQGRTLKKTA